MARRCVLVIAILLAPALARAASLFDPALRFRTIATEHFVIYFDEDDAHLAARLGVIAEAAWAQVPAILGIRPPSRTHVVLADQSDAANGWAYPLPYNTIVVTAAWPRGTDFIGNTDDWLRLVFVHEFAHIVHIDHARGWSRLARLIFGRTPFAFPNLFLPTWQIEGLATYVESRATGEGRMHSADFRELELTAARRGRRQPLDRVNGGLTDWPAGLAPYAYGMGFHQFLAEQYGEDRVAALVSRTAGRVPYLASPVFGDVFNRSLGELWDEYQQALAARAGERPLVGTAPTRITRHGYLTTGPRFAPAACGACPPGILYSLRTPHDFPALYRVDADGTGAREVATRYLGSTVGVHGQTVVFDQQERRRNVGEYSDLYALDLRSGRVRALSREERLQDPDVSPDGARIAAVRESGRARDLVIVPFEDGSSATARLQIVLAEPDAHFATPRWSPDGRRIAVVRQRLDPDQSSPPTSDIVIVDAAGQIQRVASAPGVRLATPAWRPDGGALVVAAATGGEAFQLYELEIVDRLEAAPRTALARTLTGMSGGATWPDVSPDGKTLVFVGQTTEGLDLFTIPYTAAADRSQASVGAGDVQVTWAEPTTAPRAGPVSVESAPYRPWTTLVPSSWTPIVEDAGRSVRIGVASGGYDVLGYHAYAGGVSWLASRPSDAVAPLASTPDWFVAYAYDRWRPTFVVSASRTTSFLRAFRADRPPSTLTETWQEREIEAGVVVPFQHVRVAHRAQATVLYSRNDIVSREGARAVERTAIRTGWSTASARRYGYSISREDGYALGGTTEWTLGESDSATTVTGDARLYAPGLARHHVLAIRASGGVSEGPRDLRRTFYLGGAVAAGDLINFSRSASSLLRGFAGDSFGGSRIALLNLEYRWPLARPERGAGTWPVFFHSVHGSVFGDAGHAWSERFRAGDAKVSLGAELSFDLVLGYNLPLTLSGGVAWGADGARTAGEPAARRTTAYVRVGAGF